MTTARTGDREPAARIVDVDELATNAAAPVGDRSEAMQDWLHRMDQLSREIATFWPRGVSAQDVVDDIRGSLGVDSSRGT
jgi:hypothetical protein